MKVVLFCGGLGTRLREHSDTIPKPLVNIGVRPIIWHLMRYYAYHGHKDFILCLGYRGDMIREYFLNYNECLSNDFVMSDGGKTIELLSSDIDDWRITFVDTGLHSNIGERLVAARKFVEDEPLFLANYADGLSDIPLNLMIDTLKANDSIACFAGVRTQQSFHAVRSDDNNIVQSMGALNNSGQWINGGFFVLRNSIFDYINPGEELVEEPFQRLIEKQKLSAIRYNGYWQSMDTLKDKITIDRMYARGDAPWGTLEEMRNLFLELGKSPNPSVLCLGAHCDDIEIGCAATISQIASSVPGARIDWVIFSSSNERRGETERAADRIAGAANNLNLHFFDFRDGLMPYEGSAPKDRLRDLSREWSPDVVFTHYKDDAHQDHRLVSEITYNLFRNHLILEYEIPKYDGDLGRPNVFVPLTNEAGDTKVKILLDCFESQANKHWFTDETFRSLLRLRGIESGRENEYAEAFYCRKLGLSIASDA